MPNKPNKEKNEKIEKEGFFKSLLKSIKDFDKYEDFGLEGIGRTILYLIKLIAILAVVISAISTYRFYKTMNGVESYFDENIKTLSYKDGTMDINSGEKLEIIDEKNIISVIIIDTSELSNEQLESYKEQIKSQSNGIILLKDKVLMKNEMLSSISENNYSDILSKYNIESLDKQQVMDYYNQNKTSLYTSVFATVFISMFPVYMVSVIVDSLVIAVMGYLISRIIGMRIRFTAMFSMGVHALTLSIILNMLYIVLNGFTGYTIKYFQVVYNVISYIYIITAILIIKTDYIKKQGEVQKIQSEQEKIRAELEEKQRKEEDEKAEKKNKEEKERQKEKEKKKEGSVSDSNEKNFPDAGEKPQGSSV